MELLATGFYWLPGFSNKINAKRYSVPSKHLLVFKTSSKRLQRNSFSSSKTSWKRLETSWKRFGTREIVTLKTSWRHALKTFEDVFARRLENILKTTWRCLEDAFARRLEDVLKTFWRRLRKTSWRRLGNVFKTSWRRIAKAIMLVLIKTSWRRKSYVNIFLLIKTLQDVLKKSSEDKDERHLQDVFIKTNVYWLGYWKLLCCKSKYCEK